MFFDDWYGIVRVLVVGTLAYAALVVLLRISGKRTLAKMNAFDFVVTIAIGSTLASTLLTDSVALIEGIAALGLLIGLQWLVAWTSIRSSRFDAAVKAQPRLLYYRGSMLWDALRAERVTESEVLNAVRSNGMQALDEVEAVVLETTGDLSVLAAGDTPKGEAFQGVAGPNHRKGRAAHRPAGG